MKWERSVFSPVLERKIVSAKPNPPWKLQNFLWLNHNKLKFSQWIWFSSNVAFLRLSRNWAQFPQRQSKGMGILTEVRTQIHSVIWLTCKRKMVCLWEYKCEGAIFESVRIFSTDYISPNSNPTLTSCKYLISLLQCYCLHCEINFPTQWIIGKLKSVANKNLLTMTTKANS